MSKCVAEVAELLGHGYHSCIINKSAPAIEIAN